MPNVRFVGDALTTEWPAARSPTPLMKFVAHDDCEPQSPACFRSDERLWCIDAECSWRQQCQRLVAAWKR